MKVVHPNPVVGQFKALLFAIILTIIIWEVRNFFPDLYLLAIILTWLVAIAAIILSFLVERFTSLEIGDDGLLYKKGILSTKTVLVQYTMITDTRFAQSLIERVFGVGTIEIDTAADDSVSILMNSVRRADADEVMKNLRKKPGGEPK